MRIWHQSFTDLSVFPKYSATLSSHARSVVDASIEVVVHGLRPGTYPPGVAPMDCNSHAYIRMLNARQVCEAAIAAEHAGYDAMALGCFFDPALAEARSLVDIPVVSLSESCMLTACSLGRRFAIISLNEFQSRLTEDLAAAYGLSSRLAGVVPMSPAVALFELEGDGSSVKERFRAACQRASALGAEVVIPGDGVLNAFLVRHRVLDADGITVMDPLAVLFHHAAYMARLRLHTGLQVSRKLSLARPPGSMLEHAARQYALGQPAEADFSGPAAR